MSLTIRGDSQGMSYFRRKSRGLRRPFKRQATGSANPKAQLEEDDDEDSSSDEQEEASSESTVTRVKNRPTLPASSAPSPSQTETVISMISTSAVRQSNTLALPIESTATFVTSSTTSPPRHQLSPTPSPTKKNSGVSTIIPAAEANETRTPTAKTRAHQSLSHGATIALEVIGIMVGIGIILGICLFFFRRWKNPSSQAKDNEHGDLSSNKYVDLSSYKARLAGWGNRWNRGTRSHGLATTATNNPVDNQEHTTRVRTSLLAEKELSAGLIIGPPRKATLKRDATGGRTALNYRGDSVYEDSNRLEIEAGGRWEAPVTIARASLTPRATPGGQRNLLPVLPLPPQARLKVPEHDKNISRQTMSSVTTISKELSRPLDDDEHDLPRRKDQGPGGRRDTGAYSVSRYDDGNSERGSSGGSERFRERARERESKISLAKWRDPVSWVRDQVDRRNNVKEGMERLPG